MKCIAFIFALMYCINLTYAQNDALQKIRAAYKSIMAAAADGKMVKKTKEIASEEEVLTVTTYHENGTLKYVVKETNDGSHAAATTSYYLMQDGLMFIFHDFGYWQFSGMDDEGNSSTTDFTEETRCYYKDGKAFRCLHKSYNSDMDKKPQNKSIECDECATLLKEFKALQLD